MKKLKRLTFFAAATIFYQAVHQLQAH